MCPQEDPGEDEKGSRSQAKCCGVLRGVALERQEVEDGSKRRRQQAVLSFLEDVRQGGDWGCPGSVLAVNLGLWMVPITVIWLSDDCSRGVSFLGTRA